MPFQRDMLSWTNVTLKLHIVKNGEFKDTMKRVTVSYTVKETTDDFLTPL